MIACKLTLQSFAAWQPVLWYWIEVESFQGSMTSGDPHLVNEYPPWLNQATVQLLSDGCYGDSLSVELRVIEVGMSGKQAKYPEAYVDEHLVFKGEAHSIDWTISLE